MHPLKNTYIKSILTRRNNLCISEIQTGQGGFKQHVFKKRICSTGGPSLGK